MKLLLWSLMSPINIGMILRTAEIYGCETHIHDPNGIMEKPDRQSTISDFACGALQRRGWSGFQDNTETWARLSGRLIATSISPDAEGAQDFDWGADDIILVGNEYAGLPPCVSSRAARTVTIPMPAGHYPKPLSISPIDAKASAAISNNGLPSLNVAVATAILLFCAYLRRS